MKKNGFTLIELLVVVAIIGILAAVGTIAYDGYTKTAKRGVSQENLNSIAKDIELLAMQCDLKGGPDLRSNGTTPKGSLKFWKCIDQNTNSMGHLFMDHYHFSGFTNPINGDSATWYWGNKTGKAAEGYILIDGNPTSDCVVKVSAVVDGPTANTFITLTEKISFRGRVNGC